MSYQLRPETDQRIQAPIALGLYQARHRHPGLQERSPQPIRFHRARMIIVTDEDDKNMRAAVES